MNLPAKSLSFLGRAAVKYAEHGWYVFPLRPREKQPLIAGGFLAASADPEQVRAWWTQHPSANIGLWPGQSGLVILDLDGPEGEEAGARLGALSEPTLVCTTGREDGGRHLYFRRPEFSVSNCDLAPKLDVRGDAGYVVLPPSVHPSGRKYEWVGRAEEIRELPEAVLAALVSAQSGASRRAEGSAPMGTPARELVFDPIGIGEGGRNNALTRYAGRLLAKGLPADEVLVLVSAVNVAHCKPPLEQHAVNVLVANIATREDRKRTTAGGTTLAMVEGGEPSAPPSFGDIAATQVGEAKALAARDLSSAPTWAWPDLSAMTGPMLPGDLVIVGSLMGNGKSTLLMSQMDAFARGRVATLYIPLEVDPAVCRLRWAAWKLTLDVREVLRGRWDRLPEGSREAIDGILDEQEQSPFLHFAPPKRITLGAMVRWCERARDEEGVRVVMLDHLHRMDFGADAAAHRVAVTEVVRRLKDMARDLGLVLIAAAQLNRNIDPLDAFKAPVIGRLKESAGIAEEADVALMLSRKLKANLPDKFAHKLALGSISERDLAEPNTMVITCRKHRLDGDAMNRAVQLAVVNGKLESQAPTWRRDPWEPRDDD